MLNLVIMEISLNISTIFIISGCRLRTEDNDERIIERRTKFNCMSLQINKNSTFKWFCDLAEVEWCPCFQDPVCLKLTMILD